MNIFKLFLSPVGRIGRGALWLGFLTTFTFNLVISETLSQNFLHVSTFDDNFQTKVAGNLLYVLSFFFMSVILGYLEFCILIKRLHDRGRGGVWMLPWFIFVISSLVVTLLDYLSLGNDYFFGASSAFSLIVLAWIIVDLGILQGQKGDNRFGPDPRQKLPSDAS